MPRVRVSDRGHDAFESGELTAVVCEDPEAVVFKKAHKSDMFARVCAACGYAEMYVETPRYLYAAYMRAQRSGS